MPLDFPSSPTNGQIYDRYTYNSTLGVWKLTVTSVVPITSGGTGLTSYTSGDILYASATNTLEKRTIGTTGQVLTVSGGIPEWQTPSGGGGTDFTITDALLGDTLYVGDTTPTTPAEGDIWIDESSVTGAITWGQLKALAGIASGG